MSMDSREAISNWSLSSTTGQRSVIAILRVELRGASRWRFHLFHVPVLIAGNTYERPIGYSGGQPARMESNN